MKNRLPALTSAMSAASLALLITPLAAFAEQINSVDQFERLPGVELAQEAVDLEHNPTEACILKEAGDVFCWENRVVGFNTSTIPLVGDAYQTLNEKLNNDIASIDLGSATLCGIGKTSGVACVFFGFPQTPNFRLDTPPEPDASYLAISILDRDDRTICGIQTDNRVVCWGGSSAVIDVPPEAAYLKQVSVQHNQACGIDLNDTLVCWGDVGFDVTSGPDRITAANPNPYFGTVDPATIGTAKHISLADSGACLVDTNSNLQCFGPLSAYTQAYENQSFKSVDAGFRICYETIDSIHSCDEFEAFSGQTSTESLLEAGTDSRLTLKSDNLCYITSEDDMICTTRGFTNFMMGPFMSQFPDAPENLTIEAYSDNAVELFWDRPSDFLFSGDNVTDYEVYRDDILIDRIAVATSYFDNNSNPNAAYEIRAARGSVAGASSLVSRVNSIDNDVSTSLPTPVTPTTPTDVTVPAPILTGAVYSSTAVEIFWNRATIPGVTYNIFRDFETVRTNSPAISQGDGGLSPGTTYIYTVFPVVDGIVGTPSEIELTTSGNSMDNDVSTSPPTPVTPVTPVTPTTPTGVTVPAPILTGAVYSSTAVEIFWNRATIPGVTYNIFRDFELLRGNSPAVSQGDGGLSPGTTYVYTVFPIVDGIVGTPSEIELTTNGDSGSSSGSTSNSDSNAGSGSVSLPTTDGDLPLSALVYSPTASELFWDRDTRPNVTYDIFRDDELIRQSSPATSQFDPDLLPGTQYAYRVVAMLNGAVISSGTVELTTGQ